MTTKSPADYLKSAMDDYDLDDNERAMVAAICMGESRMFGHSETGYSHTANDRIRTVFGERVENLSDERLSELKSDDESWFDFIYSPGNRVGKMLGNTQPDDGFKYRGRGFIQLTGRANYAKYGEDAGHPEIVSDPDKANDPEIAAALAVAYIADRWDGGDFESMMRCVGNNTPDIRASKEGFYEQFQASGEWKRTSSSPRVKTTKAPRGQEPLPVQEPHKGLGGSLTAAGEELMGMIEKLIP
jgi:predicted chitinase